MMMMMILVRFVSIFPAISRMVCAHCDSESQHTGHSVCTKYCTPWKERGHRQKRARRQIPCVQQVRRLRQHDRQKRFEPRVFRPQVHQLRRHARTEGPQLKQLPSKARMQRMRQHDPQKRFALCVPSAQVQRLRWHARAEGPQPK